VYVNNILWYNNSGISGGGVSVNGRTWRRYKALLRYMLTYTDFLNDKRVSFVTLTLPHMPLRSFNDRFRRALRRFLSFLYNQYGVESVYAYEPHKDGFLHAHIILWNAPYIDKMELVALWFKFAKEQFPSLSVKPSVDIQLVVAWDLKKNTWVNGKGKKVDSVLLYVAKYISKNVVNETGRKRINAVTSLPLVEIYKIFSLSFFGSLFVSGRWFAPRWSASVVYISRSREFKRPEDLLDVRRAIEKFKADIKELENTYFNNVRVVVSEVIEAADMVYINWLERQRRKRKKQRYYNSSLVRYILLRFPSPVRALRYVRHRVPFLLPLEAENNHIAALLTTLYNRREEIEFLEVITVVVLALALTKFRRRSPLMSFNHLSYRFLAKGKREEAYIFSRSVIAYVPFEWLFDYEYIPFMPFYEDLITPVGSSYLPSWFLHVYEGERRKKIREIKEIVKSVNIETPPALPLWSLFSAVTFLPRIARHKSLKSLQLSVV